MPSFELASLSDVPALSRLLSILFIQETEFHADETAQSRGLTAIINNPDLGTILVAREGSEILAMVNLLYTVSTALGERVAVLEDMVVAPQARAIGIGSALLTHAINHAKSHGIKRITLLTDRGNTSAQAFYMKHGFTESTMVPFRLSLD